MLEAFNLKELCSLQFQDIICYVDYFDVWVLVPNFYFPICRKHFKGNSKPLYRLFRQYRKSASQNICFDAHVLKSPDLNTVKMQI